MTGRTVWLASYPKSGNTWLRAVYTALRTGAEPDINSLEGGNIATSRWLFDAALGLRSSDLRPEEVQVLRPRADEAVATAENGDVWRKIHDALFHGPSGELIVSSRATRAAVYIVRDPRDVAVSLAHHEGRRMNEAVDVLCCSGASLAKSGRRLYDQLASCTGTWSEHVRSWVDQAPFPVHVLRYEDCLAHPVLSFREAFAAAGIDASESEVAKAVDRASRDRLQAQEEASGFRERQNRQALFFRRGVTGSWREELSADLADRVVEEHGEMMARLGYL